MGASLNLRHTMGVLAGGSGVCRKPQTTIESALFSGGQRNKYYLGHGGVQASIHVKINRRSDARDCSITQIYLQMSSEIAVAECRKKRRIMLVVLGVQSPIL